MKLLALLLVITISTTLNAFAQSLFISNTNIVDVKNGAILSSRDVLIEHGIIKQIVPHKLGKSSGDVTHIDGAGKFIIPGFIDTHVHVAIGPVGVTLIDGKPVLEIKLDDELTKTTAKLLLDHGVTTARDPGGFTEITVSAKNRIAKGEIPGPELLVAGSIIDTLQFKNLTSQIKTEQEIRDEILLQKEAGVDMVKLYTSLSPRQLKVGIDYAHSIGLTTVSHLHTTTWTQAAELGLDNIVHIIPGSDQLLPNEKRADYNQAALLGAIAFYKWFEYVDLESSEITEMIAALVENDVSVDPTLVPFHAAFFGNQNIYQSNPKLDLLPRSLVENWETTFNFNLGWNSKDFEIAQSVWPKVEKLLRMLDDAGILLTAGTDANNPWIVPGDSFHEELQLFGKAGFSNAEVLKIATYNGAKLMKIEDRVGLIKEGYEADLVILDENPLHNLKATREIYKIINNGKVIRD